MLWDDRIFQHILANVATGVLPRDAAGRATLAAHLASGPGITFEYSIPYVQILHGNVSIHQLYIQEVCCRC